MLLGRAGFRCEVEQDVQEMCLTTIEPALDISVQRGCSNAVAVQGFTFNLPLYM